MQGRAQHVPEHQGPVGDAEQRLLAAHGWQAANEQDQSRHIEGEYVGKGTDSHFAPAQDHHGHRRRKHVRERHQPGCGGIGGRDCDCDHGGINVQCQGVRGVSGKTGIFIEQSGGLVLVAEKAKAP